MNHGLSGVEGAHAVDPVDGAVDEVLGEVVALLLGAAAGRRSVSAVDERSG